MYIYLYKKIYVFFKSKKNPEAAFNTILIICAIQGIHLLFLISVFEFLFDFKILRPFSQDNSSNKLLNMPLVATWLFIVYILYRNKHKSITKEELNNPIRLSRFLMMIFIVLIIPLIILIKLGGG